MQLLILTLHFGVWRRLELSIYAGKGHLEIGRREPDSVFVLFGLLLSSWNRWIIWQVLWRGVTPTDDAVDVADENEKGLMDMKRGMLSDTLPEAKSEEIGEDHDEKGAGLVAQGSHCSPRARSSTPTDTLEPPTIHPKTSPNIRIEGDGIFFMFIGLIYYAFSWMIA